MKKQALEKMMVCMVAGAVTLTGFGSVNAEAADGEKKDFTIYNCAGAAEYHESVVVDSFKEAYGDKYNVQYETLSAADTISKIEAQGYTPGSGNINIVIMGDSDVPKGLQAGAFADLSDYKEELHYDDMTSIAQEKFDELDESAVQIYIELTHAGIAYMPETEKGALLAEVIGDDGKITYDELKDFMTEQDAKMGRGTLSNSGPGDVWTWGLLQQNGEYKVDDVPQKSIDWISDLYANGNISLYGSTSATFKDLVEGGVDIIPHTPAWYFRLYALGKANDTLPEELQIDSFGLEDSEYALMDGDNVTMLVGGHYYMIPSNLSEEDFEASMEFLEYAITPEINSLTYTSLMMPSYEYSSLSLVEDEDVLRVWDEVSKYLPEEFMVEKDGLKQLGLRDDQEYESLINDVNLITTYANAWQESLESQIQQ
jgi:putative spermidine/putrescine transport system substrate-binding protein